MNSNQREALHRAVDLALAHQPRSFSYPQQTLRHHHHSDERPASPQLAAHAHSHATKRHLLDAGHRASAMTTSGHGATASTYPSQRHAGQQRERKSPPKSRRHPHVDRHPAAPTSSHHRDRSPSGARHGHAGTAARAHHARPFQSSQPHHDAVDRRRHRSRDGSAESDVDSSRAHRDHRQRSSSDRVSRRARTEGGGGEANSSTTTSPRLATSSPSLTALADAAVPSLLPASSVASCLVPLDAKLIELLYALSPTAEDRAGKLRVIDAVRQSLQRTGLDIQIYGSLCTGLVIPASDVDCVMMRSSDDAVAAAMSMGLSNALLNMASAATNSIPQRAARAALSTGIRTAADRMRRHPAFTSVTCIAHAKVPIVKCRHRGEDVKVDLSFEKDGCVSSNYLCELFCEPGNELARPLIVLIKALVNHCGLDDPSVGGLGSFPISLLVLWYLKHCVPARYAPELRHSVAVLLVGFLQYYGTEFDFKRQGIDYVQQKTFSKAPANDLYIVNLIRPGTNCARAATLYATRVVPQFEKAAAALTPLLDVSASATAMEQRLLQYFAKALPGVREWRDVARAAAQGSHLPQNMWDQATNLYMGGVL